MLAIANNQRQSIPYNYVLVLFLLTIYIAAGKDTFVGDFGFTYAKNAYGGEVIALAAKAALMTLGDAEETFLINSVHCNYVSPGKEGQVSYHVERVKDGQTFCFRSVTGVQKGRAIISCIVCFKLIEEHSVVDLPHNIHPMPSGINPPQDSIAKKKSRSNNLVTGTFPLDVRFVSSEWDMKENEGFIQPTPAEPW